MKTSEHAIKIKELKEEIKRHESVIRCNEFNEKIHREYQAKYWTDYWKRIRERPESFRHIDKAK